jgi:plastocyanin
MSKKLLIALATLCLAAFALAACGDDDSTTSASEDTTSEETTAEDASGGGGEGGTIAVEADPGGDLAFTETELTTSAGPNTIDFNNPADVPHDVYIEDDSGEVLAETETVTGEETTADADLEAGTYTFFCSVPGHREAGMEGTLTVE